MPPILRRSNSQRSREFRRSHNSFSLKLLGLALACVSVLLTVYELSSDGGLAVEDGRERLRPRMTYLPNAHQQSSLLLLHHPANHSRSKDEFNVANPAGRVEREVSPLVSSSESVYSAAAIVNLRTTREAYGLNQDSLTKDGATEEGQGVGEDKQQQVTPHEATGIPQSDVDQKQGQASSDLLFESSVSADRDPRSDESGVPTFVQRLFGSLTPWFLSHGSDAPHIAMSDTGNEVDTHCQNGNNALPSIANGDLPRVIPKCWKPPKQCGTAEEMGSATAGNTNAASLRIREMIKTWMAGHGADAVRNLPGADFCDRKFVLGLASDDGFGNNMYKVLTAAGLALVLNRSLILGERGANTPSYIGRSEALVLPFGDYLLYSNQSFSMREVKHLWALHDCTGTHMRPFTMRVDDIEHGPGRSKSLCDDWTTLSDPVLWFKGTMDTVALQFLLKNRNAAVRSAAATVLGKPSVPSSRPNTFGELLRAFVAPSPDIQAAVEWTLKGGPEPDFALHLRLRHNRSQEAPAAASACILRIIQEMQQNPRRKQRVVVISDTPEVFNDIKQQLGESTELIRFDFMKYLSEFKNLSEVMSLQYGQPPRNKMRDWGEMPRWVSLVDFYLAARARVAVVSGASERVCTTYVQLVGSLAAASTLTEDHASRPPSVLFSSFQRELVAQGLMKQAGWGHAWRTFGGKLGCKYQSTQCARTALLPYAWWDAPWQSPTTRDIRKMQIMGIEVDDVGQILEKSLDQFCEVHQRLKPFVYKLKVPA